MKTLSCVVTLIVGLSVCPKLVATDDPAGERGERARERMAETMADLNLTNEDRGCQKRESSQDPGGRSGRRQLQTKPPTPTNLQQSAQRHLELSAYGGTSKRLVEFDSTP